MGWARTNQKRGSSLNAPTHIKTLKSTQCFVAGRSSIFKIHFTDSDGGKPLRWSVPAAPPPEVERSWRPPRSPPRHAGAKSPTRGKSLVFISDFQEFLMKCCEVVVCPLCHESSTWGLFSYAAGQMCGPRPLRWNASAVLPKNKEINKVSS